MSLKLGRIARTHMVVAELMHRTKTRPQMVVATLMLRTKTRIQMVVATLWQKRGTQAQGAIDKSASDLRRNAALYWFCCFCLLWFALNSTLNLENRKYWETQF